MLKKMIMVRVGEEISGQGSERSPSPRPVLSILRSRATAEDGRSNTAEGGPSPARERESLRLRGGNAGAPGWRGTVWGNGSGSRIKANVRNNDDGIVLAGGMGEGTVVGHRGSLTRDLDLDHNLVLFGPVRTFKGNSSEWGCGFITQDTDGELLTPRSCPEIRKVGDGRERGVKASRRRGTQSKPWPDYGAPRGARTFLRTWPGGERGERWVGGDVDIAGIAPLLQFATCWWQIARSTDLFLAWPVIGVRRSIGPSGTMAGNFIKMHFGFANAVAVWHKRSETIIKEQ